MGAHLPGGYRVALYEPPLPVTGSLLVEWLPRYEQEMARGRLAAALGFRLPYPNLEERNCLAWATLLPTTTDGPTSSHAL